LINVDSTIHPAVYLDAKEACALLGVKRETLYAYTSRGLVRALEALGPTREKRYLLEDLRRLKTRRDARSGHGPVAAAALDWGEPVLDSRITAITPRGPRYRGYLATELAVSGHRFEAVARLLSTGSLATPADENGTTAHERLFGAAATRPVPASAAERRESTTTITTAPLPRAIALFARLALEGVPAPAGSPRDYLRAGAGLTALPALLAPRRRRGGGGPSPRAQSSRAATIAQAFGHTDEASAQAVDAALILSADHELNVSSFTARAVASSGVELLLVLVAAMSALSGPRHGTVSARLGALLREARAVSPRRLGRFVRERVGRGEPFPGFGHPLYPDGQAPFGDPRGRLLLDLVADPTAGPFRGRPRARAGSRLGHDEEAPLGTLLALVEVVFAESGQRPTLDVGLLAIALGLGSSTPAATAAGLFLVGRSAGWIAHAEEQRAAGFLLRPRARYVGEAPREIDLSAR
jgi:citrate synthase